MRTDVTVDDLATALQDAAHVLDVRESDEYAAGHVPGAQLVPLGVLPVRLQDVPRSGPVYVLCQGGGRSAQAADVLDRAGYDVRNVLGGTSAWIDSGREVETGGPA